MILFGAPIEDSAESKQTKKYNFVQSVKYTENDAKDVSLTVYARETHTYPGPVSLQIALKFNNEEPKIIDKRYWKNTKVFEYSL